MNRKITRRLREGERFLLDGATGSELQRRKVDLSAGISEDGGLGVWSATAMRDAPDQVRAVHEDYLRVGAQIITTNSFWTNPGRLALAGLADEWEAYTGLAGELAIAARDGLNPAAFVAGGMAPPGNEHVLEAGPDHGWPCQAARGLRWTGRRLRQHRLRPGAAGGTPAGRGVARARGAGLSAGALRRIWSRVAGHRRADHRRLLRDHAGSHRGAATTLLSVRNGY